MSQEVALFKIYMMVEIESLKARVQSLRQYVLNTDANWEADVIEKQIKILEAKFINDEPRKNP